MATKKRTPVTLSEDGVLDIKGTEKLVEEATVVDLVEHSVRGTSLTLLGPKDPSDAPLLTVAQRVKMAERLVEVGPRLPRYTSKEKLFDGIRVKQEADGNVTADGDKAVDGHTIEHVNQTTQESTMATKKKAAKKAATKTAVKSGIGHISADLAKQMKTVGDGAIKAGQKILAEKKAKEKEKADAKAAKASGKPAAKKAPAGAAKGKARGIGTIVRECLKAKKSTEECIAAVKKEFPEAKTTPASVAWYRNDMREKGELPKA